MARRRDDDFEEELPLDADVETADEAVEAVGGESPEAERAPRPPRPVPPRVIFSDDHLLVIDKPSGALSVSGRGNSPILANLLRKARLVPEDEPFRVVHRLDRGASGVMIFARTLEAQQSLSRQFEERVIDKTYIALVNGHVPNDDGEIDLPLRSEGDNARVVVDRRRGKPAVTRYRVLERVLGASVVECHPLTGRLHQIRAHMAAIGHPLAIDALYGGGTELRLSNFKARFKLNRTGQERPLIDRLTLHALRIRFAHPSSGDMVEFEAPLPKDLRTALNQLRRL